jgi:hypothetical protein
MYKRGLTFVNWSSIQSVNVLIYDGLKVEDKVITAIKEWLEMHLDKT